MFSLIFALSCLRLGWCLYEEEVQINRLKSDLVNSALIFKFNEDISKDSALYLNPLYQLLSDNYVSRLELSVSQGFWRSDLFGQAIHPNQVSGVQIVASFEDVEESDSYWRRLVSQLNGMLCTAVLSVGETLYAKPILPSVYYGNNTKLYYGAFTGDRICTENIDSFKKLLPCQNTGFTRLLGSPKYLYETKFTSASIIVNRQDKQWSGDVRFSFLKSIASKNIKFSNIFGSTLTTTCYFSDTSRITIDGDSKLISNFDVNATNRDWKVELAGSKYSEEPSLRLYGFTRFKGLLTGRFVATLKSNDVHGVLYTHLIPWEISVWFSTITVTCDGKDVESVIRPTPAFPRKSPTLIEIKFVISSGSICQVSYEFEKSFLYMNEYPPDANHGITVPGAIVTLLSSPETKYYSEPTVITLPSPDVTMPYNVVCFIGTMGALIFQIIFTFTTQYQTIIKPGPSKPKKLVINIKEKISRLLKH
ncbi:unnamed protein product [Bursaphelenchus xylophilus]|nr:unnamed protein product [Bursaphelenchus xylophilus]CAG9108244.1 unnamed protein product [Bursaphelenchus xylophilus]